MRGDENKNIDVPSKVKAFRQDFAPNEAAIRTSFAVTDELGAPAVVGKAQVVLLSIDSTELLLSEAFATRGLRPPVPGAAGMKDTRDAERAMTGAVGRALFLMGYGEKPDDSADYEEPGDWYKENGWASQEHHDSFMEDAKLAIKELGEPFRQQAIDEWHKRQLKWPLPKDVFEAWVDFLITLGRKAAEAKVAEGAGDETGEPAPTQPSLEDAVGPDASLVKR